VVLDPGSAGLAEVIERRRRSGLDRLDEVWEGELHMIPAPGHAHASLAHQLAVLLDGPARAAGLEPTVHAFSLGDSERDFRVPDGGLHRPGAAGMWHSTAALIVEIVSPGDETWEKLPFYAAYQVDEVLIADPQKQRVDWLALERGVYRRVDRSGVIELGADELCEGIDWPELEVEPDD
jgi:hypothetical protein